MNIYMVLCDELRADALGYAGNSIIKTPNIDALANDSVKFSQSYCNSPMCVPSRLSIATGRHALSHGALDNMMEPTEHEKSFFQILQENGYHTTNHGKWHGNIAPEKFGFHTSTVYGKYASYPENTVSCFGIDDRKARQSCEYKKNNGYVSLIISGTRPSHKDDVIDTITTDGYLKDIKSLKEQNKKVCARLSIIDPHTPYLPAEPFASMYNPNEMALPKSLGSDLKTKPMLQQFFHRGRGFDQLSEMDYKKSMASYYGLVSHIDEHIGRFVATLKEMGEYDDSLIIFTADHGSMLGEHGYIEKWGHMYEQVLKTPLFIKMPKGEHQGKTLDGFVESIDIMPTILELVGLDIPENVQGKSLLPYIKGETTVHKNEIYAQYFAGAFQDESALVVRDAHYKCSYYGSGLPLEQRLFTDDPLRMSDLFDGEDVEGELYDMQNDPDEIHNLYNDLKYRDIKEKYLKKIEDWKKSLDVVHTKPTTKPRNTIGMPRMFQGDNMERTIENYQKNKNTMRL